MHENYEKCFKSQILISKAANDSLYLKEDSDQYHQIQGQLHITNKMCCDMIVWTLDDIAINPIAKDATGQSILKSLPISISQFIPAVIKRLKKYNGIFTTLFQIRFK